MARRGRRIGHRSVPAAGSRGSGARLLFENRRQARKVRWVGVGLSLFSLAFVWWGVTLTAGAGSGPADDVYAGAFAVFFGLLCGAAMAVYRRHYVVRLSLEMDAVTVTTLGWLSATEDVHHLQALVSVNRYGDASFNGVRAPWVTLRVAGRRVPYILDAQAERCDEPAIRGLVRAGRRR